MSDLTLLYQDIILGHNKNPRNYGPLEGFTGKARGHNPLCGDEVTVYWKIQDGIFTDISFEAQGCAISRASASIMTELLKGKTISQARDLLVRFNDYLRDSESMDDLGEELGDLASFGGVREYPSRIKCATLAWHTCLAEK